MSKFSEQYDNYFQAKALSCMAKEAGVLPLFSQMVKSAYFDEDRYRVICTLLSDFYKEYKSNPSREVLKIMISEYGKKFSYSTKDIQEFLNTVDEIYGLDTSDYKYIKDKVVDFCQLAHYRSMWIEGYRLIHENPPDLKERLQKLMKESEYVGYTHKKGVLLKDVLMDLPGLFGKDGTNLKNRPVPTGFPTIDRALSTGGLTPGDLALVIGHSNAGKSQFCVNIGYYAALQGIHVDHITLELDIEELSKRYSSRILGIPLNDVAKDPERYQEEAKSRLSIMGGSIRMQEWPMNSVSISDIRSYLKTEIEETKVAPSVLIIDYLDLVLPPGEMKSKDSIRFGIISTFKEAIRMCKEDVPCVLWTPSQGNRATYQNAGYGQEAVAESWDKVQLASLVACIHQTEEQKEKNMGVLFIDKLRRGKRGLKIPVHMDYSMALISEYVPDGMGKKSEYFQ